MLKYYVFCFHPIHYSVFKFEYMQPQPQPQPGKIFLKSKKINFDSARPVLSSKEAARNNSLKESILS